MPNSIKESGEGAALQVTGEARSAGLVEENSEGDATRRADVRIHGFKSLLLVIDLDRVGEEEEAELVASAARDTQTAYRSEEATIQHSGNGYQVQLPPAGDAGFDIGDTAPVGSGEGVLVIHSGTRDGERLARDLLTIRDDQVST